MPFPRDTYQPGSDQLLGEIDFPHPRAQAVPGVSGGTCPGVGDCPHIPRV